MGPDRELDLSIHIALNPDGNVARITSAHPRGLNSRDGLAWELSTNCVLYENWSNNRCWSNGGYPVPAVTESIDAAMTLVPEGWRVQLFQHRGGRWIARLVRDRGYLVIAPFENEDGIEGAVNAALALCIAALKAQLSTRTNEQDDARNLSGVSSE